LGLGTF